MATRTRHRVPTRGTSAVLILGAVLLLVVPGADVTHAMGTPGMSPGAAAGPAPEASALREASSRPNFLPPLPYRPAVGSGSNVYYVGAQGPTTTCNPACTYLTNGGARTTVQVVSQTVTGCLSYWIGDDSGANLWGQVGYYICNGATPVAFYQIWNLNTGAALTTGTANVSAGYHTFSLYSQSGGNVWAFAVDTSVFGTYDLGASVSLGTYPVQAVSEEGLVSGPWVPGQVVFSTAIQTLQTANTNPAGNGWTTASSGFDPWGGCTSSGIENNTGGYTCWGLAGNQQDHAIQVNSLVTGGTTARLRAGSSLWSGSSADFTLTANPASVAADPGSSGTSLVTVGSVGGFAGTVSLSASVSPATGLTCSLSPAQVTGSGESTLNCTGSAAGGYTVTVTGTNGTLTHSTPLSFTVNGPVNFTLSFAVVGGGSGYAAPIVTYVQGGSTKTAVLTASATTFTPDANSLWSVTNPLPGSSTTERWQSSQLTSGAAAAALTTVFTFARQYHLAVQVNDAAGGTVTGSSGWHNATASTSLVAAASPGWQFHGWMGSGTGSYSGNSTTAILAMDSPVNETAVFYAGLTLTAIGGGTLEYAFGVTSGSVPAGGTAAIYVPPGTNVTLRASPSLFSQLEGWSGSAAGTSSTLVLVVSAPRSVTGTFGVSLYSKPDSVLGLALACIGILAVALILRRRRLRKKKSQDPSD